MSDAAPPPPTGEEGWPAPPPPPEQPGPIPGWHQPQPPPPTSQQPPPPPPGGQWPPPPPPPAWGQPQAQPPPPPAYGYGQPYYPQPAKTDGTAIAALCLAIGSWVLCPIIMSAIALALVPGARRNIETSGGTITGEGLLTATKIISWINIALFGLIFLFIAIAAIIGAGTADNTNDFGWLAS